MARGRMKSKENMKYILGSVLREEYGEIIDTIKKAKPWIQNDNQAIKDAIQTAWLEKYRKVAQDLENSGKGRKYGIKPANILTALRNPTVFKNLSGAFAIESMHGSQAENNTDNSDVYMPMYHSGSSTPKVGAAAFMIEGCVA